MGFKFAVEGLFTFVGLSSVVQGVHCRGFGEGCLEFGILGLRAARDKYFKAQVCNTQVRGPWGK